MNPTRQRVRPVPLPLTTRLLWTPRMITRTLKACPQ